MKLHLVSLLPLALVACGGGGGSEPSPAAAAATTPYTAATPQAGTVSTYGVTQTDNLGNTFNRTFVRTVTTVFSDGTYASHWADPTASTLVSGTVNHTAYPTDYQLNGAGQDLSYTVSRPAGAVTCTDSLHGEGPPASLAVGQG